MERTFNGSETVGAIAADFPGAVHLFKAYRIDFCCGGHRVLAEVLEEQGIEREPFLDQLNRLALQSRDSQVSKRDWREAGADELIAHIVGTHHTYLSKELPLLDEFITRIVRVHGRLHPELARLHSLFRQLKTELEQHLIAEEKTVFPLILKAETTGARADAEKAASAIDGMESDHSAAGDLLKEMREVTQNYLLPEDACRTYTVTFRKLEELESDLFEHIHLENNLLFPRMKRDPSAFAVRDKEGRR